VLKVREIHCDRWFLPRTIWGITVYPFIFYNKAFYQETLRRHEWTHVEQIRRDGYIKFHLRYFKQYIQKGYMGIDYEIEAYKKQHENTKPWQRNTK